MKTVPASFPINIRATAYIISMAAGTNLWGVLWYFALCPRLRGAHNTPDTHDSGGSVCFPVVWPKSNHRIGARPRIGITQLIIFCRSDLPITFYWTRIEKSRRSWRNGFPALPIALLWGTSQMFDGDGMLAAEWAARISTVFGVKPLTAGGRPVVKQAPRRLEQSIENYAEITDTLVGTGNEWMLEQGSPAPASVLCHSLHANG